METEQKLELSLVIIALNEERNIERCIKSVPFASEVIVVDSFSTDKTPEIAKQLGAKVVDRTFTGFRDQKEYATNLATQPWVLSLDADEALSEELQIEIKQILQNPEKDGYRCPRVSYHLGRWIRHGGWYPDWQLRLFKKEKCTWVGGQVHESVSISGEVGTLKNDLQHFVFRDLEHQIDTNNRYSSLGAQNLIEKGKRPSTLKLLFKPLGKFIECYFWKKGFLDGQAGFIIALGAAQSMFLKYAKLWAHHHGQN